MNSAIIQDVVIAMPEIVLAGLSLLLLVYGVFIGDRFAVRIQGLTMIALLGGLLVLADAERYTQTAFNALYISTYFTTVMKMLVLTGAFLILAISLPRVRAASEPRFEFPILVLLSTVGMMLMISSNDFMSLYMGLELTSLPLYVLASMERRDPKSAEAGLKYFVLGALASGMILYGITLVYGFSGVTNFTLLADRLALTPDAPSTGVLTGMVLIIVGLCFKVSAVPFHMWAPDVYEGAPTPVTALFAVAPKIAAIALFVRVLMEPFITLFASWQPIIIVVSVGSMIVGAYAAMMQENIKRLLAYSSIGHVGFALMGLAAGTVEGIQAIIVYMALYLVMSVGAFAIVLLMQRRGKIVEQVGDLAGLSRSHPMLAAAMMIYMFSMAGIPWMAGFFGKLMVFSSVVDAGLVWLAVVGVLASVVGAFYYLRIVKRMYFDPAETVLDIEVSMEMRLVILATAFITLCFVLYPSWLLHVAKLAALSVVS